MKLPLWRHRQDDDLDAEIRSHFAMAVQDALGKRIRWGTDVGQEAEIVGIVGHIKQWGLDSDDSNSLRAQLYQDFDQQPGAMGVNNGVIVRTSGPPLALVPSLKQRVQQLNAENVVFQAATLEQVVSQTLDTRRSSMLLLGAFAGLAVLLAAVGIYGVTAYLVGRRTQEFGIRMALGAQPSDVMSMVMAEGGRIAALGVLFGVLAALGLTRAMTRLLFGVKPTDPATFGAVSALLAVIALAACYLPARRATRVDPMVALRYE